MGGGTHLVKAPPRQPLLLRSPSLSIRNRRKWREVYFPQLKRPTQRNPPPCHSAARLILSDMPWLMMGTSSKGIPDAGCESDATSPFVPLLVAFFQIVYKIIHRMEINVSVVAAAVETFESSQFSQFCLEVHFYNRRHIFRSWSFLRHIV